MMRFGPGMAAAVRPLPPASPAARPGSWGRRPVAERNRYVDEMARLRPGTLHTADPADLATALRVAAGDPESTRHGLSTVPFSLAEVADAYLSWWDDLP